MHKAAGGEKTFQPANFTRRVETYALVAEIANSSEVRNYEPLVQWSGRYGGTYVSKELVYAYAMWISAAFHLKVIRAYDRLVTQGVAVHENAAEAVLNDPLKFLEIALGQAKVLKAERDKALEEKAAEQAKNVVLLPKAEVFDAVVADKNVTLAAFVRTLGGFPKDATGSEFSRAHRAPGADTVASS